MSGGGKEGDLVEFLPADDDRRCLPTYYRKYALFQPKYILLLSIPRDISIYICIFMVSQHAVQLQTTLVLAKAKKSQESSAPFNQTNK